MQRQQMEQGGFNFGQGGFNPYGMGMPMMGMPQMGFNVSFVCHCFVHIGI